MIIQAKIYLGDVCVSDYEMVSNQNFEDFIKSLIPEQSITALNKRTAVVDMGNGIRKVFTIGA